MADGPVLVTGGTGMLGAAAVSAAVAHGCDVVTTWHHEPPPTARSGVGWEQLDLSLPGAAAALVRSVSPSLVIHTAYVESGPLLVGQAVPEVGVGDHG